MHANGALIQRFYEAFQRLDAESMAQCYAPTAVFSDAVFPHLVGPQIGAMWKMLVGRSKGISVAFRDVHATESGASAHWTAHYEFGAQRRKVVNEVNARFRIQDGLIVEHRDHFGFWKWSRQALGPVGFVLGWTPFIRNRVRSQAASLLSDFTQKSVR